MIFNISKNFKNYKIIKNVLFIICITIVAMFLYLLTKANYLLYSYIAIMSYFFISIIFYLIYFNRYYKFTYLKILKNEYRSYSTSIFTLFFEETVIPTEYICTYKVSQGILMKRYNLYKVIFYSGKNVDYIFLDETKVKEVELNIKNKILNNVVGEVPNGK